MGTNTPSIKKTSFAEYLKSKGYDSDSIRPKQYRYGNNTFERIEITDNDRIIQAFVVMKEDQYNKTSKFPFYRVYNQRNKYGESVNPACFIAVHNENGDGGKWTIWDAKNTRLPRGSSTLLDYNKAVERFNKRWESPGNENLYKKLKVYTFIGLGFILLYFLAHILSINGFLWGFQIPLNTVVAYVLAAIAFLLILIPIMPYIRSLTFKFKDTSVEIHQKKH